MYSLPQAEFADRRRRFIEAIGPDAVAIFVAPPMRTRSHDTSYPYRASSDILYLSGFREPDTVLVLAPGHDDGQFVMFVPPRDPLHEMWEGRRAGPEGAKEHYGADAAYTIDQLDAELPRYLSGRKTLYYTLGRDTEFDLRVTGWINRLRHRRSAPPAAPAALVDARDVLHEQRLTKTERELELIRQAARISAEAHTLAMKVCRPGMHEYELQAVIEYHFRRNGAEFPAYNTIVGTGRNAAILHYTENRDRLEAGQLVLIDAGCEFDFYAGDITRTFPVSGRFTPLQREVYQAVLEVQKAAVASVRPGLAYNQMQQNAVRGLTEVMVEFGLLSGSVDELIETTAYKKYYPHSLGHWLGIDVHDVGSYHLGPDSENAGQWRPLEPGMVLTIEPGLYVPDYDTDAPAELRGFGIRIEDDVVVTAEGHENITHMCPKSVEEIEAIVGSGASPL